MGRRLFGARKREQLTGTADWPQLPGVLGPVAGEPGPIPLPPPLPPPVPGSANASTAPAEELLDRIAAFRSAVSDALYEASKDYQILCNLAHADLTACDEIVAELRRRLSGNIHFEVLAKLDDVHAFVAERVGK
jgi:hypothetical protein